MNKYLVIYKVIKSDYDYENGKNLYEEEILNDIFENDKCNEDLLKKIYHSRNVYEDIIILNIIQLES